jgi:uncharacterized integral membrane protein
MPGALLRTGNLQEFKALGVDGQPVYSAALQLREAIRLKMSREDASCLAIPQPNETGDKIDWYAPYEGDVVPWSAATAEERRGAYQQLEAMHRKLGDTSTAMTQEGQSREKQIFGRLLEKAVHFPDSEHVYLVDGKPVVTFWGFTDQAGSYVHDPLLCLRPAAPAVAPVASPAAPLTPPPPLATAAPVVVAKRSWWRWLLWLLPFLLLLLLLLFLLRACAPNVSLPLGLDQVDLPGFPAVPRVAVPGVDLHGVGVGGATTGADASLPDGALPDGALPDGSEPPADQPKTEDPAAEQPPADPNQPENKPEAKPEDAQQPPAEPQQEQPKPREQPPGKDVPQDLSIPPQALKTGSTEFLNGSWKAGAGIQDAQTGKPMQLEYDFKDGKGQVKVRRGDGVECAGDVNAAMQGGKLAINSQGQAKCNDGSSYKLPEVSCSPDSRSAADCSGKYENQQFPMSMRQGAIDKP